MCRKPIGLYVVKSDKPWAGSVILAAVDVGNGDSEHRTLHTSIVSHGYDIATLAKAELHVITAHPAPMLSAADPTFQLKETIQARYREQCKAFQVEYDISDGSLEMPVPPMMLQTLVENAIKHGISQRIAGGRVELSASVDDDGLSVVVRNDGQLNQRAVGLGIGLSNSHRRLRLLYGREDLLRIEQEGDSVISSLHIPTGAFAQTGHG